MLGTYGLLEERSQEVQVDFKGGISSKRDGLENGREGEDKEAHYGLKEGVKD